MALEEYGRKRRFAKTPEPPPEVAAPGEGRPLYVIQKHSASHLHYDLRLQIGGVLASWAVPKGPSLDPADKRLAVHVEDHPVEYGDFEGVIPEGEYGAGTVMVWDRGFWEPHHDIDQMMAKGHLSFTLQGEKLGGGWNLVRIRGGRFAGDGDRNWLLIKEKDEWARPGAPAVEDDLPRSASSGRTLEEISADKDLSWHTDGHGQPAAGGEPPPAAGKSGSGKPRSTPRVDPAALPGAKKAGLASWVRPELCLLVDQPPEGDEWLHEIKFDGFRMLCRIEDGAATLWSRNEKDWTDRLAPIAGAASRLDVRQAMLDGEVVLLGPDGVSDFSGLKEALGAGREGEIVYQVFDVVHLDGHDLAGVPLGSRKEALAALLGAPAAGDTPLRYTDHVIGDAHEFFRQACRHDLEGIVSKRRDSLYRPGERGHEWVKTKCGHEQEFVILGYTDPEGQRQAFGALALGYHDESGRLHYAGRVGTGFTGRTLTEIHAKMRPLEAAQPEMADPPKGVAARGVHWLRPELVGEVRFTEWTPDGSLRHPSFKGLREDKTASEIVRELPARVGPAPGPGGHPRRSRLGAGRSGDARRARPAPPRPAPDPRAPAAPATIEVAGIALTHADKVLYPEQGITKLELAEYYEQAGDWMIPHLADRPLTLVRCPDGWEGQCFFQKHIGEGYPAAIRRVQIAEEHKTDVYGTVDSLAGIIGLVQMGVLEIHTWGSHYPHVDLPDRLIFDFDPAEDRSWADLVRAVRLMKSTLESLGLAAFAKTTGGKGLHVVAPIRPEAGWRETEAFARAIAEAVASQAPADFTTTMSKQKREGRIFIDYLRNANGATAVAAFSARARRGAPVSVPISWDELGADLREDHFTAKTVPARLAKLGRPGGPEDPWGAYGRSAKKVTKKMRAAVGLG